jgi:hypothetical protein
MQEKQGLMEQHGASLRFGESLLQCLEKGGASCGGGLLVFMMLAIVGWFKTIVLLHLVQSPQNRRC